MDVRGFGNQLFIYWWDIWIFFKKQRACQMNTHFKITCQMNRTFFEQYYFTEGYVLNWSQRQMPREWKTFAIAKHTWGRLPLYCHKWWSLIFREIKHNKTLSPLQWKISRKTMQGFTFGENHRNDLSCDSRHIALARIKVDLHGELAGLLSTICWPKEWLQFETISIYMSSLICTFV